MEAILDTNFIISCLRKRIDFIEELENLGFKAVVPREVIQEMKDIRSKSRISHEDKLAIEFALKILEDKRIKKIKLGRRKVDEGLIAKGKEGIYIATLDSAIKRMVPNRIIISNARKALEIDRE